MQHYHPEYKGKKFFFFLITKLTALITTTVNALAPASQVGSKELRQQLVNISTAGKGLVTKEKPFGGENTKAVFTLIESLFN